MNCRTDRINKYILSIAYTVLFSVCIICLCNYNNAMYQTEKEVGASMAMLFLSVLVLLIRKADLFNYASLISSVVYFPLAMIYRASYEKLPDVYNSVRINVWTQWVCLLIIVDTVRHYKDLKKLKFDKLGVILYALMAILMAVFRNGRSEYHVLFVPFMLLYLVKITKEEYSRVINAFANAWLVAFVFIMAKSLITNPYVGGRYYGCFVNLGVFGVFFGAVISVAFFRIWQSKFERGRKSVFYILSIIWLVVLLAAMYMVDTRTLLVGVVFSILVMYLFIRKKNTKEDIRKRFVTVGLIFLGLVCAAFVVIMIFKDDDHYYWYKKYTETNSVFGIVYVWIERIPLMFNQKETQFKAGMFEIGSIMNALDTFTSGRLSLAKFYSNYFSFLGNTSDGFMVGNYYAVNSHSQYIQVLYEYGYLAGIEYIIFWIYCTVKGVLMYLRTKSTGLLLAAAWLPMLIGLMTGEIETLFYPGMFMSFVVIWPILRHFEDEEDEPRKPADTVINTEPVKKYEKVYVLLDE